MSTDYKLAMIEHTLEVQCHTLLVILYLSTYLKLIDD
jgi:hypothetical protein